MTTEAGDISRILFKEILTTLWLTIQQLRWNGVSLKTEIYNANSGWNNQKCHYIY